MFFDISNDRFLSESMLLRKECFDWKNSSESNDKQRENKINVTFEDEAADIIFDINESSKS